MNRKIKTVEDAGMWRAQECTCPAQKELTYCHPDCLMFKMTKQKGKVEEVKKKEK